MIVLFTIGALLAQEAGDDLLAGNRVGRTWPIVEKDALVEIEERAARAPEPAELLGDPSGWSGLQSTALPAATETRIRQHIPWYTLPFDMKDSQGRILYPKGYQFNPAQYVNIGQRLVIVREDQLTDVVPHLKRNDMLVLAGGNLLRAARKTPIQPFLLDEQMIERFALERSPSFVRQEGSRFIIEEIAIDDLASVFSGEPTASAAPAGSGAQEGEGS